MLVFYLGVVFINNKEIRGLTVKFDYDRSIPVSSIKLLQAGTYEIRFVGRFRKVVIDPFSVDFVTRPKLMKDTSTVLVDLGKDGFSAKRIVIAAENTERFRDFFYWNQTPFPEKFLKNSMLKI